MSDADAHAPLPGKRSKVHRVVIDEEMCKGCKICVVECPTGVLAMGEAKGKSEGEVARVVAIEKCTGCALCEAHCPDFCIAVDPEGDITWEI